MSKSFFTIGIYTFKNEQFLEQALRSVLDQTFTDFECILVDDGSSGVPVEDYPKLQDKSFKHTVDISGVEQSSQANYIFTKLVGNDPRFKFIRKKNEGLCEARNMVFGTAEGKWYVGLDGDDWLDKTHLQKYYDELNKPTEKFKIVFFSGTKFYNSDTYKPPVFYPANINLANLTFNHILGHWNFPANLGIIKKYEIKSDSRIGPGPNKEIQIIKTGGFDDVNYAWRYVEALEKEYGKSHLEFVDTHQDTYMYRDIPTSATKQNVGLPVNYNHIYANYMKPFCLASADSTVRLVGNLYPVWTSLWDTQNPFKKILKSGLTFTLRLITHCYF